VSSRLVRTDTAGPYVLINGQNYRPIFPTDDERAMVGKTLDIRTRTSRVYSRVAEVPYPDDTIMLWIPMERKGASRSERDAIITAHQESVERQRRAMEDPAEAKRQEEEFRAQFDKMLEMSLGAVLGLTPPSSTDD
jgi:hypothetical protein